MTTTPRWDDERQRWERSAETPLPEPEEAGAPWLPAAGLAVVALVGASPALAGAQEEPGAYLAESTGTYGDGPLLETTPHDDPSATTTDPLPRTDGGLPDGSSSSGDHGGGGGGTTGGGSGGDGSARDPEPGGSGGDAPEDTASDEPVPSDEPSPEPSPSPDAPPSLDPDVWEMAEDGDGERVFTLIEDDAFEAVLTWDEGDETDLERVLEDRVRVPARDEEGYEEISALAEGEWEQGEPAFEYLYGTGSGRHALATALVDGDRVVTLTLRGPAEEGRQALEEHLVEVLGPLGVREGE
ncbi:hypothetical protein PWG71_03270 [Nocardiopsis sp. N85]|uniref:hypothetical protein n=1 Tax=Nocardiopsis sp. N85 TaxID=3029400 RepID=UPI00237F14C0|nr:hypothetical protein [Nocardiopsis sp. N85]MDE3720393.1 hypothetical protein [Nocardiopsis sp. N85]